MSKGFGVDITKNKSLGNKKTSLGVSINVDEVSKILKDYKKLKRYMNSNIYEVKVIDNEETIINDLINGTEESPN